MGAANCPWCSFLSGVACAGGPGSRYTSMPPPLADEDLKLIASQCCVDYWLTAIKKGFPLRKPLGKLGPDFEEVQYAYDLRAAGGKLYRAQRTLFHHV